ncbi:MULTISPECIES: cyclopropane-fatty-acyl-phospholipid synthase family protein [unclassified Frankia]|uniref:SAM-dependent methyltransferase n=1 Tax=unclassified Frankia TaxID=2632575 RepID=UPI001EF465F2|nr:MULTISPECIES: class I SAM-dependent methyltransferase [unclassified Frankia]
MTPAAGTALTAVADTNQHYDLDPEIFGLFLDPSRKYSAGRYQSPSDTLAQAQINKLRFVAERLGLRGGEQLLDVGCGWGSLLLFMAREHGCRAVGISPAGRQHEYIRARSEALGVATRVTTLRGHFEETSLPSGSFDAVTMLGSIVHMPDLTAAFRRARTLLRRGGCLYVSESCFRSTAAHTTFHQRAGTRFVGDSIFGWGDLRPVSELVRGAEDAGFSLSSLDDLTDDYRRTIDDWLANVRASAADIERIKPGLAERLERYLEIANAGWGYTTKHYALTCRKTR